APRALHSFPTRRSSDLSTEELITIAESSASCEVYGLLKRPDEKFVTEMAYDNPKYVANQVLDELRVVVGHLGHELQGRPGPGARSEEHTSELQSLTNLV